jgi:RNA polymerase sigma factor (sigma-70 family)
MSWDFALQHRGLVAHFAKKFQRRVGWRLDTDEMVHVGLLVLHDMSSEFDEERGRLSTFCFHSVYREFERLYNNNCFAVTIDPELRYRVTPRIRPFFEQATKRPGRYEKDHDPFVVSAVEGEIDLADARDWVRKAMRALPRKHRAQLIQRFGMDGCQEHRIVDMARMRGITEKAMDSRLRRTIHALLDEMLEIAWMWGAGDVGRARIQ